jgi:hypothetical protein
MVGSVLLGLLLVILCPFTASASTSISLGTAGLQSIEYNGVQLALPGGCQAKIVDTAGGVGPSRLQVGPGSLNRYYHWGSMICRYAVSGDRINVSVDISNTTGRSIPHIVVELVRLAAAMPVKEGGRLTNSHFNLEGPDIISVSRGSTAIIIASEDVGKLLVLRAQPAPGGGVSIAVDTMIQAPLSPDFTANALTLQPSQPKMLQLARQIPAGQHDHYSVVLCFLPQGASPRPSLGDLFARIAARFPATLNWPDRRPIGFVTLASHGSDTPYNRLNPRYWRFIKPSVDVTSPNGQAEFQARLLEEADKTIAIARSRKAQGVIVWDIEGQPYRQPVSYIGDPRKLPPEMEGVVDKFFRRFTDAGLRCGVTIRPQKLVLQSNGQASQENSDSPQGNFAILDDKIRYTKDRWGCSLFYIDSSGTPGWPIDSSIFQRLAAKYPNVLLSPEQKTIVDFAWTAGYWDARVGPPGSREARWIYPKAFSLINVSALPQGAPAWQDLQQDVQAGDVLVFAAWSENPASRAVLQIYQQALH